MEADESLDDLLQTCNPNDLLFSDSKLLCDAEFPELLDLGAIDFDDCLNSSLSTDITDDNEKKFEAFDKPTINFCDNVCNSVVSYHNECDEPYTKDPYVNSALPKVTKQPGGFVRGHQRSTSAGYISVIKSNELLKPRNVQAVVHQPVGEGIQPKAERKLTHIASNNTKQLQDITLRTERKQAIPSPQPVSVGGGVQPINIPRVVTYTSASTTSVSLPTTTIVTTGLPLILNGDQLYTIQATPSTRNSNDSSISDGYSDSPRDKNGEWRKSSHNVIERRYRSNINDKMVELKNMVSDGNSKLSKSQILKKAIDTIRYLQNVNERLRDENYRLRAASGKSPRIEDLLSSQPRYTSASCGQVTPPHSDISDVPSPFSSGSDVEPVSPTNYKEKKRLKLAEPKKKNGSGVARAMIDRSRITLCMFTLAVLVFNPFGRVFEVMYAEDEMQFNKRSSGRNLRSIDETPSFLETASGLSLLLTSVINIMLLTLVFLRLFVYGEPIPDQKSEAVTSYWRHRKQADSDYDSGNYQSSAKQYTLALSTLGRCLPTSRFDAFASVVWQGIRQLLHLCGLGKWLGARAGGLIQPKARRIGCRSILAEIAFCYHRLNQLQLTNHLRLYEESLPDSRFQCLYGLSLCLAALNMAEGAGSALSTEQLAEVYMTTAVRMKLVFNSKRKILSRFWLRKARDVCTKLGSSIPPHLQWLCSPHGHRFFLRYDWCFMKCVSPFFTKSERKGDPLCLLMQMYRQYVLHCAFDAILASNRPSKKNDAAGIVPEGDALTYINLLDGICYAPSASGDDLKGIRIEEYDSVCSWWGSILLAANHWLLGENDKVTLLHPRIEAGPGTSNLLSLQNAMLAAYRSRRLAACKAREEVCYKLIGKASKHLEVLLAVPQSSGDNIVLAALLIAYDWVLEARTLLWEYTYKGQEVPPPTILSRFQDDLAKMRKLAHQLPSGLPKMFPHELTVRAMAGGASAVQERKPLRHRQRHLQGRGYEEESGSSSSDREEIAVLMRENMTSGIVEDQLEKPKETDFLKKKNDDFGVIKNLGTALITLQSAAR